MTRRENPKIVSTPTLLLLSLILVILSICLISCASGSGEDTESEYGDANVTIRKINSVKDSSGTEYDIFAVTINSVEPTAELTAMIYAVSSDSDNAADINDIVNNATLDAEQNRVTALYYDDGGSAEYLYDGYTLIKKNSLDGDRDVYICMPEMTLNDINMLTRRG